MIKRSLARRYAKALLALCQQENNLDLIRSELDNFFKMTEANKELQHAIFRPCYPKEEREALIKDLAERIGWSELLNNFLCLLIQEDRISSFPLIIEIFNDLADDLQGLLRVKLKSAESLNVNDLENIKKALRKIFKKDILVDHQKDRSLIGGIEAQIGSIILDGTIKNKLRIMAETLRKEL